MPYVSRGLIEKKTNPLDCIGKRFGRLTAIEITGKGKNSSTLIRCRCDCGGEKTVAYSVLHNGAVSSCGCLKKEAINKFSKLNKTHGCSKTHIYKTWQEMRSRCNNPNKKKYECYGGRGIKVCNEWNDFMVFREWALTHGYEDGLSIERKDVNGDYCPENCEWIPFREQKYNKRNTVYLTYNGKRKPLIWWGENLGISIETMRARRLRGWSDKEIIEGRRHGKEN